MKMLYIAGPYRADTPWLIEQNIRNAEEVAILVAKIGAIPVCPHSMYRFFQGSLPDEFWLGATLGLLKKCDGIVMIPWWKESSGSRGEHDYAKAHSIKIFYLGLSGCEKEIVEWLDSAQA